MNGTTHKPTILTLALTLGAAKVYQDFYLNNARDDSGDQYFTPVTVQHNTGTEEAPKYEDKIVDGKPATETNYRLYVNKFKEGGAEIGTVRVVEVVPGAGEGGKDEFKEVTNLFPDAQYAKMAGGNRAEGDGLIKAKIEGKVRKDKETDKFVPVGEHAPFEAMVNRLRVAYAKTVQAKAENAPAAVKPA